MRSGWLLRDGDVICALEMAESRRERTRACGADSCTGGVHLPGVRWVHTGAMRFPLDVAMLSDDLTVVRVVRLNPWRMAPPRPGVRSVVQAEAGAWERWGVREGDQLVIRPVEDP